MDQGFNFDSDFKKRKKWLRIRTVNYFIQIGGRVFNTKCFLHQKLLHEKQKMMQNTYFKTAGIEYFATPIKVKKSG